MHEIVAPTGHRVAAFDRAQAVRTHVIHVLRFATPDCHGVPNSTGSANTRGFEGNLFLPNVETVCYQGTRWSSRAQS